MNNEKIKQTVLIIEDDPQDAAFTIFALKKSFDAISYIHLSDVDELANFDYASSDVDVIFMDLKMPKVSGIDLLVSIKNNPQAKNIPIVILSSSSMPKEKKQAYRLGISDFIIKPIDIEKYYEVVRKAYKKALGNTH